MNAKPDTKTPSLIQVIASVAASFFGVQGSRNRERDFTHGKPWHFIAIAFLMTGVVALVFFGAVQLVLHMNGH